ncbi:MAG: geranylgeranylglycerol-phosphate geranylgeranyltransferase [Bacteroidia bacterium]
MQQLKAFFILIRLKNLIIIAITQYLMRYAIIEPMISLSSFELQLSHFDFFLMSLATVLVAAGGYIINDYFDTRIDRINRPDLVVIDTYIKRRVAMGAHLVSSIAGILLGFYVAYKAGVYQLGFIYAISSGMLWFYSTDFKRQLLIGNLVISFLTALVPIMVPLFEIPLLNKAYGEILLEANADFTFLIRFIGAYSLFAFISSLIREIIKDIEDMNGDTSFGRSTIPIAIGIEKSKLIIVALSLILIVGLAYIQYLQYTANDLLFFTYLLITVQFPMLYLIIKLIKAKEPSQFAFISKIVKAIMLAGVLSSILVYINIQKSKQIENIPAPTDISIQVAP